MKVNLFIFIKHIIICIILFISSFANADEVKKSEFSGLTIGVGIDPALNSFFTTYDKKIKYSVTPIYRLSYEAEKIKTSIFIQGFHDNLGQLSLKKTNSESILYSEHSNLTISSVSIGFLGPIFKSIPLLISSAIGFMNYSKQDIHSSRQDDLKPTENKLEFILTVFFGYKYNFLENWFLLTGIKNMICFKGEYSARHSIPVIVSFKF